MTSPVSLARPVTPQFFPLPDAADDMVRPKAATWSVVTRGARLAAPVAVGCIGALAAAGVPGFDVPRIWRYGGALMEPMTWTLWAKVGTVGAVATWLGASAVRTPRRITVLMAPQMRRHIQRTNDDIASHRILVMALVGAQIVGFMLLLEGDYSSGILGVDNFAALKPEAQTKFVQTVERSKSLGEMVETLTKLQIKNPFHNFYTVFDEVAMALARVPGCICIGAVLGKVWLNVRQTLKSFCTLSKAQAVHPARPMAGRHAPRAIASKH
jgi:hypothetical protein